jgi:hypothetical protein
VAGDDRAGLIPGTVKPNEAFRGATERQVEEAHIVCHQSRGLQFRR